MVNSRNTTLSKILDGIFILIALVTVGLMIWEYGFYLTEEQQYYTGIFDIIIVFYFLVYSLLKLLLANKRLEYLRNHWFIYLIAILIFFQFMAFLGHAGIPFLNDFLAGKKMRSISKLYIIGFQISILLSIISQAVRINQKIAKYPFHPAQILLLSFLIIILVGSGLLSLPKSVQPGHHLSMIDALFTATSATCVTGLIVQDTGQFFSVTGQIIILALIQVGALGIMTYASFFALILGRSISLREKLMLRDIMNYENVNVISRLVSSTVLFTLIMEITGAILLFWGFKETHPELSGRLYSAIFHSVSAFSNAGFSLSSTNLIDFNSNYLVLVTVSTLIIAGGLGFPVVLNIFSIKSLDRLRRGKMLTVQTRLVLGISAFLIISGWLFVLLAEQNAVLEEFNWPQKIIHAYFQSVTTRTAGFNSIDIGILAPHTILFMMMLMFIGASPGSTGGGIKTTTAGILAAGVWSVIRGRNRVDLFKKDIPFTVLNRSIVIFIFSVLFVFIAVIILSYSEKADLMDIMFEAVSAFGTVGLSRGITGFLSLTGKITIILLMFFGRLGALTISLAITSPREVSHYSYPPENVMVG